MTISAVGQADNSRRAAPLSAACRQCDPLHVGGAPGGEVGGGGRHQAHSGGGRGVWPQAQGAEDRQRWGVHGG
jgi:hypothetical protein